MKIYLIILLLLSTTLTCPGEKNCQSCTQYENNYKCTQCENTIYSLIEEQCIDIPSEFNIENCKVYSNGGNFKCRICELGYRVNLRGECEKCDDINCAYCDSDKNKCEGCFNKHHIFVNKCDTKQNCELPNCEICHKNEDICLKCEKDYSLNGGQCVDGIYGCLILDLKDNKKCSVCDFGYFINKEWSCGANDETGGKNKLVWILIISIIIIGFGVFFYSYYIKADQNESDEAYRSVED